MLLTRPLADLRGPQDPRQRLLAWSTLVNTVGMGLFLSAGTIFLIRSAGLSPAAAGIGLTVGSLIGFGAGIFVGDQADRRGAREVVIASMLLEAVASVGLLLVRDVWTLILVATVAAIGRAGSGSARGALIGVLAEEGKGPALRTYLRAVTNVGLAVGMLGSAVVLAVDSRPAYVLMVLTDTVTFLVAAAVLARLPHLAPTRSTSSEGRWLALRDRRYLAFTAASSVASLQYWVLIQALPVWIVLRTAAPRSMAALVLFVAAVTVAVTQIPATRSIDGPRTAARLLARSGPLFLVAWILMALASGPSAWVTVALLLVAVLVHSLAEVWQAAGTFELSFALARPEAQGQYQGVVGLGHGFVEAVAPVVVITLCIEGGKLGWVALALVVTVAGWLCALIERRWPHARVEPVAQAAAG
ncbi:Major Facilitator Superfamily protein [Asanoa hainanensis]|uniref:Major Facilitator Superfamily protein n=1 Tax=Asanoa hainanensis TaxID=560556 RepID=A0A239PC81_9ACTN|nr:MFS transporter [Asanoa hainanensis]SNT64670.1 Major Facilitator Superfamily protein [Asanoa hainanensis]